MKFSFDWTFEKEGDKPENWQENVVFTRDEDDEVEELNVPEDEDEEEDTEEE